MGLEEIDTPTGGDYLMKQPEVLKRTSKSKSSLHREINEGTFPAPVRIGKRAVAWRASEINAWMDNLPKAAGMES